MKFAKTFLLILFVGSLAYGECSRWNAQNETAVSSELIAFLQENDPVIYDKECVIAALTVLGHQRGVSSIPVLIKFLEFRRSFYWEGTEFAWRPVSEFDHYPAAEALFEIGKPALPALLAVASAEDPNSQRFKNAVNTIMSIHRDSFPEGVRFLHRAAVQQSDPRTRTNLEAAAELAVSFCDKNHRKACLEETQAPLSSEKNSSPKAP